MEFPARGILPGSDLYQGATLEYYREHAKLRHSANQMNETKQPGIQPTNHFTSPLGGGLGPALFSCSRHAELRIFS
jgi:hypothetical protein